MESVKHQASSAAYGQQGRIVHRPRWVLYLSLIIRAIHQIGAAAFLCAFLPDMTTQLSTPWLLFAVVSGGILLFTEWLRHRQIGRELSGLATFIKILLLGAAFHGLLPPAPTVIGAFVLSSVCAHAPKHIRHRMLY
jgi:NhaP-type Na+/H+ or K+/H+ antiporter